VHCPSASSFSDDLTIIGVVESQWLLSGVLWIRERKIVQHDAN